MFIGNKNTEPGSEIIIELRQNSQDAMITILKESHTFSDQALKRISKVKREGDFKGDVNKIVGWLFQLKK